MLDLKRIPEATALSFDEDSGLSIGAATPCSKIYSYDVVQSRYPALVDCTSLIGSIQIQNRGTVGGNFCNASPAADTTALCYCPGRDMLYCWAKWHARSRRGRFLYRSWAKCSSIRRVSRFYSGANACCQFGGVFSCDLFRAMKWISQSPMLQPLWFWTAIKRPFKRRGWQLEPLHPPPCSLPMRAQHLRENLWMMKTQSKRRARHRAQQPGQLAICGERLNSGFTCPGVLTRRAIQGAIQRAKES